jgi:hypothetical protein
MDCTYLAARLDFAGVLSATGSVIAAATISPNERLLACSPRWLAISQRGPFPLVDAFWVTARCVTKDTVPGLLFFPGS